MLLQISETARPNHPTETYIYKNRDEIVCGGDSLVLGEAEQVHDDPRDSGDTVDLGSKDDVQMTGWLPQERFITLSAGSLKAASRLNSACRVGGSGICYCQRVGKNLSELLPARRARDTRTGTSWVS